jgi:hypothetical protein
VTPAPVAANGQVERVRVVSETAADHSGTGSEHYRGDRRASGDVRHVAFDVLRMT